jgi:predicted neuraminidase
MTTRHVLALALATLPTLAAGAPSAIVASEFVDPAPPYPQAHASTIVELADGTLAAAWFGGSGEGRPDVRIWFARHTAAGWDTPRAVAAGDGQPAWNPVLFQPPAAPLQLYYKVGPNPRDWRGTVIESRDGGRRWSTPRRFPAGVLGPIKNKPVIAPDGTWLAPSSREVGSAERNHWYAVIERSTDRGRTWTASRAIASRDGLEAIQPSLLRLRDGRLMAVARTRQGVVAASWSRDSGRHWSPLTALALPNPNAGTDAVTLADGRQLLVYNDSANRAHSDTGPRWPLAVALSDDGMRWRKVLTLEDQPRPDGYAYPSVIQARNGLIHVTYTWNRERIRHVTIEPRRLE